MNLVDTSGWIEYFFEEKNASFFAKPIEDINKLIVPVLCIYEVFKKVNLVADEAKAFQAIAQMKQGRLNFAFRRNRSQSCIDKYQA